MSQFFLAHEFAHAALLHSDEKVKIQEGLRGQSEAYILSRSREMEFEADIWAQDCLAGQFIGGRSTPELVPGTFWAAPCIAFLLLDYLDHLAEHVGITATEQGDKRAPSPLHATSKTNETTHPTHRQRFDSLFDYASKKGGNYATVLVYAWSTALEDLKRDLDIYVATSGKIRSAIRSRLQRRRRPTSSRQLPSPSGRYEARSEWAKNPTIRSSEWEWTEAALSDIQGKTKIAHSS